MISIGRSSSSPQPKTPKNAKSSPPTQKSPRNESLTKRGKSTEANTSKSESRPGKTITRLSNRGPQRTSTREQKTRIRTISRRIGPTISLPKLCLSQCRRICTRRRLMCIRKARNTEVCGRMTGCISILCRNYRLFLT